MYLFDEFSRLGASSVIAHRSCRFLLIESRQVNDLKSVILSFNHLDKFSIRSFTVVNKHLLSLVKEYLNEMRFLLVPLQPLDYKNEKFRFRGA